jgi:hypothetical protein
MFKEWDFRRGTRPEIETSRTWVSQLEPLGTFLEVICMAQEDRRGRDLLERYELLRIWDLKVGEDELDAGGPA